MHERKWYIAYTKPQCERKIAARLAKENITVYCPIIKLQLLKGFEKKVFYRPLFSSFVFVYASSSELSFLKKTTHVISLVYWLSAPAILSEEEIISIKNFLAKHKNIRIKKTVIGANLIEESAEEHSFILPAIGYKITGEPEVKKQKNMQEATIPEKKIWFQRLLNRKQMGSQY